MDGALSMLRHRLNQPFTHVVAEWKGAPATEPYCSAANRIVADEGAHLRKDLGQQPVAGVAVGLIGSRNR
jgi:hypothetical protein